MLNAIGKLFTSAHKDYLAIHKSFRLWQLIALQVVAVLLSMAVSFITSTIAYTNSNSAAGGILGGAAVSGVGTIVAMLVAIPLSLVIYALLLLITQLVAKMLGYKLTLKQILKVTLIASIPGALIGVITSVFSIFSNLLKLVNYQVGILVDLGVLVISFGLSLVSLFYFYYILINGYKALAKMQTKHAYITGCLPSLIYLLVLVLIVLLCVGVMVLIFGISLSSLGSMGPGTYFNY